EAAGAALARVGRGDHAARPSVPPPRRGPAGPVCRLHRPGRALRRLRLRPGRALPEPPGPPRPRKLGQAKLQGGMMATRVETLERPPRQGEEALRAGRRSIWPFLGPAFIASVAYIDPANFAPNT